MLELRYDPDPILTQVCEPVLAVDEDIRTFVAQMKETMTAESGAGLAAPQVGRSIRIFVMAPDTETGEGEPLVFINPVFVTRSQKKMTGLEGCLSFPERPARVSRHEEVAVRALDVEGNPFTVRATGFMARCIQHEYDHLEGKTIHPIV